MNIVLALGNPGTRYAATRHNIGWMVADAIAGELRIDFHPAKGDYYEAKGKWKGNEFLLVKPTTYMNNSGIAARQLVERYGVPLSSILVIVDEIQFPVGRLQMKPSGSSGGHNGVESMIYHLDSIEFPRLRCGVGRDFKPGGMAEYVLSPFPPEEEGVVTAMVSNAREVVLTWIAEGMDRAMNQCNTLGGTKPSNEAPTSPSTTEREP